MSGSRTAAQLRSGSKWNAEHRWFKARCRARGDVCWKCGLLIDYGAEPRSPGSFTVDHALPIAGHPERVFQRSLYRPAHHACNDAWRSKPDPAPTQLWDGYTPRWMKPSW